MLVIMGAKLVPITIPRIFMKKSFWNFIIAQFSTSSINSKIKCDETILERATEESGVLEHGEIIPNVPLNSVNNAAAQSV